MLAFLILVIGALLTAAGVMGFLGASDVLEGIEQQRSTFNGVGGLLMDLRDWWAPTDQPLGAETFGEYKSRLEIIRVGGIGAGIFGGFLGLFALARAVRS